MIRLLTLTFLLVLFSSLGFSYQQGTKYQITFYHVNDTHGAFYKSPETDSGGFAILANLVKSARSEATKKGMPFFLTSGGDVNTGVAESDVLMGEPDFRAMNALDFDAMVVGNHEFDKPWKHLKTQQEWAEFPFLAANIRVPNNNKDWPVVPYIIKEQSGLKFAFLGLTTEHARFLAVPANTQGLEFEPAIEVAKKWVPSLRDKADVVVVLSHLGWCPQGTCTAPNDVLLARAVPGIDIILGGHSHSAMETPDIVNGTFIFQAFEKNQKVGILKMEFLNGKLSLKSAELRPLIGKEDPALLKILGPLKKASQQKLKVVIGKTPVLLDGERTRVRRTETNLGNLLTLAFREQTKADLAIMNGGGIRSAIQAGDITLGDIYKVVPFSNTLCTVEMTGQELLSYMEKIAKFEPESGSFPQLSGVSLKTDRQDKILELKINNKPIQPQKRYKVALNNFLAEGGDFYPNVKTLNSFVDTGHRLEIVLRHFIEEKKQLSAEDIKVTGYYQRRINPKAF